MVNAKKIELIIEQVLIADVKAVFEKIHITGYTLIKNVAGLGLHGDFDCEDISEALKNCYFIIACDAEKAERFINKIRPLLDKSGGIIMVSDIMYIEK